MNGAFCRHELRRPKGNRVRFAGMNSGVPRAPETGRPRSPRLGRAVGLVIPRPVARLQSRTPLHQAPAV
jgi:hypothetical protein